MSVENLSTPELNRRLLCHLWRGGSAAHLWRDQDRRSHWMVRAEGADAIELVYPEDWPSWKCCNVYFGVNPTTQIPPTNAKGEPRDPEQVRSQNKYIAAVNCFFADFDGKHYVQPEEYYPHLPDGYESLSKREQESAVMRAQACVFYANPDPYRERARNALEGLEQSPSVVVDTGGGYHAYWLFAAPHLTTEDRTQVGTALRSWVGLVGADKGAADLSHLLRLPGSYNRKEAWRGQDPRVAYVYADFERLYNYADLAGLALEWARAQHKEPARRACTSQRHTPTATVRRSSRRGLQARLTVEQRRVIEAYNRHHTIRETLRRYGYEERGDRFARPGGRSASVVVDDEANVSWHWSSSDAVYAANADGRPRATTPFTLYMVYEHGGDLRRAVTVARQQLYALTMKRILSERSKRESNLLRRRGRRA